MRKQPAIPNQAPDLIHDLCVYGHLTAGIDRDIAQFILLLYYLY
jgi:hypothetical protein